MIQATALKKQYRLGKENTVNALGGVTFEVGKGEMIGLIGPSGSGKSTILNILGGLDSDYEGSVKVDDKEIRMYEGSNYRRHIVGTVFQQFYLMPSLSVVENILLPTVFSGEYKRKETKERLEYLLDKVGLGERKNHKPSELSGGQAQRVAIARALLSTPKILLADEPTGNLDSRTGKEIMDLLNALNQEEGTTMVIVSHDPEIISSVSKKIHLKDGMIIN